jgi:hypothetical protein
VRCDWEHRKEFVVFSCEYEEGVKAPAFWYLTKISSGISFRYPPIGTLRAASQVHGPNSAIRKRDEAHIVQLCALSSIAHRG